MNRRLLFTALLAAVLVLAASANGAGEKSAAGTAKQPVTLVFTSWRTEDIDRMNRINETFRKAHPDIKVNFQPISDREYDAQVQASFASGVGPDIMFVRSYDPGREVYNGGYLADLGGVVPSLKDFPQAAKDAWQTENGSIYAVPFVGVTHGVYYNKAIFAKYGLSEPATWSEFIAICETLKKNGETVFAQGTLEGWPLYEVVFSGLGANFYGGEASRQKLMAGKMKLTDPEFLAAFKKEKELEKYFPKGYESIDYVGMQQMFGGGKAAMFIGGSWEIGVFEDLGSDGTKIGWFAPPVEKKGDQLKYCFHVDAGIGMNKAGKNLEAAKTYIEWTAGPEFAQLFMNQLPGFFAYTPGSYSLTNPLANKMMAASKGADLTVRTVWQKMSSGTPSGNELMGEALILMLTDQLSPEQAAKHVQDGIAGWYAPFKN